jgi:hypothetical protein
MNKKIKIFLEKIDCNFPYIDQKQAIEIIIEAR